MAKEQAVRKVVVEQEIVGEVHGRVIQKEQEGKKSDMQNELLRHPHEEAKILAQEELLRAQGAKAANQQYKEEQALRSAEETRNVAIEEMARKHGAKEADRLIVSLSS